MIRFNSFQGTTTIYDHDACVSYVDGKLTISFDFDSGNEAETFVARLGGMQRIGDIQVDGNALSQLTGRDHVLAVHHVEQAVAPEVVKTPYKTEYPEVVARLAAPVTEDQPETEASPLPATQAPAPEAPKAAKRTRTRKAKDAEPEQQEQPVPTQAMPDPVPEPAPARMPPVDMSSPAWSQTADDLRRTVEQGQQAGVLTTPPERGLFAPLPTTTMPVQQPMFAPVRPGMAWQGTTVAAVQGRVDGTFDVVLTDGTLMVVDAQANVISSNKPISPPAAVPDEVVTFDPDALTRSVVEANLAGGKPIEVIRYLLGGRPYKFPPAMIVAWAETKPAGVVAFTSVPDPRSRAVSCLISLGVTKGEIEA